MPTPCPCGGTDFLVLPTFKIPEMDTTAGPERVMPVLTSRSGRFLATDTPHGRFEVWICEACSQARWFARDLEEVRNQASVERRKL